MFERKSHSQDIKYFIWYSVSELKTLMPDSLSFMSCFVFGFNNFIKIFVSKFIYLCNFQSSHIYQSTQYSGRSINQYCQIMFSWNCQVCSCSFKWLPRSQLEIQGWSLDTTSWLDGVRMWQVIFWLSNIYSTRKHINAYKFIYWLFDWTKL